ncbi:TPA: hypothetical protein SFZ51_001599 [Campylobacter jejuni]|nr:hypothetical protein [Campylobacter jejuni]HEG8094014.1 hypothetical protein [Campylobacter jejuni]HEG8098424.1 hypothetical protein [Campylobacter jejuni]HEG8104711.1 hypothetical protein [Campylobacter jejuni]HEG8133569.1 hypothetical protein [Campylobacter jejuni]
MTKMSDLVELAQKVNNINSRHPITYTRDNLIRKFNDGYVVTTLSSSIELLYMELQCLFMTSEEVSFKLFEFNLRIKSVTSKSLQAEVNNTIITAETEGAVTTYSVGGKSVSFHNSVIADLYELLKVSREDS